MLVIKRLILVVSILFSPMLAWGDAALVIRGRSAAIGALAPGVPPVNDTKSASSSKYSGIHVPLALNLEAKVSPNFSVIFDLDYTYNNYPERSLYLGTPRNYDPALTPQTYPYPLSHYGYNSSGTLTPYGSKMGTLQLAQAYLAYATPFGIFQAGRMPRNWGLGIWLNSAWNPYSGQISTSDAVSFASAFSHFKIQALFEIYNKSQGGRDESQDASAWSVFATLGDVDAEPSTAGFSRELGLGFSSFQNDATRTSLQIVDIYGKLFVPSFSLGGEFLFFSGDTKSAQYQALGGDVSCPTTPGITCSAQKVFTFSSMVKAGFLILGPQASSTLKQIETERKQVGTALRSEAHLANAMFIYASGDKTQFIADGGGKNGIGGGYIHPSVNPPFLMFITPFAQGMPGPMMTNITFLRFQYEYEHPKYGSFAPSLTWGRLNTANPMFGTLCKDTNKAILPTGSIGDQVAENTPCDISHFGKNKDLGVEFELSYRYTMPDLVQLGADVSYWRVGKAWENSVTKTGPKNAYGIRLSLIREF